MDFDRLPLEMRQHILNFLPVPDLLQQALVCRAWNVLVGTLIPKRNVAVRLHAGVDRALLVNSVRKYNSIVVYLVEDRSTSDMERVYELIDAFRGKFQLNKWYIKVGSSSKLIECYETFEDVFQKLAELHVCFLPFQPIDARDSLAAFYDLHLDELQVLHWEEPQVCAYYSRMLSQNSTQFNVFAPKLKRAKILFKENSSSAKGVNPYKRHVVTAPETFKRGKEEITGNRRPWHMFP
ncbi:hypothetical protein pipiens_010898 [Culex pipiens pipiens]|uniref:F-box domain-containing protein n=1 Tax=Culex pipiens pipiens TaxID=38569 RepID=A0ABD1DA00_CULPP